MGALNRIPFQRRFPWLRARRVVAVDPGVSSIKLVLVERAFGVIRLLRAECVDLREEGLLSHEDASRQVEELLRAMDHDQIALVLPQHRALAQVIDLPAEGDERKLLEDEIVKLSGLAERAMVYDYASLEPFGRHPNPYWITLAQEAEVLAPVAGLNLPREDVCETTTGGNALIAAARGLGVSGSENGVLMDVGAATTTLAVVLGGQGVLAGTLPIGADTFTEAISSRSKLGWEEAEVLKRSQDLFSGPGDFPALKGAVQEWRGELEKMLEDWAKEHPEIREMPVWVSGGAAEQRGWIEYLNGMGGVRRFEKWTPSEGVASQFVTAYGGALHALELQLQSASLLPVDFRRSSERQRVLQRLQFGNFILLLIFAMVLMAGTWNKLELLRQKNAIFAEANMALSQAKSASVWMKQLAQQYDDVRPVLERHRQSLDLIAALGVLQEARSNFNFWCSIVGDQSTYFSSPGGLTNAPAPDWSAGRGTNVAAGKYAIVADVCLPENGEAMRKTLNQLVSHLRQSPVFRNVDTLATNRSQAWLEGKLTVPEHHFALTLELAETEFQHPLSERDRERSVPPREVRPGVRTFQQKAERTLGLPGEDRKRTQD